MMKNISYSEVNITGGYLFEKQELNRKITVNAVYDRFRETGRISAFRFDYDEARDGAAWRPHIFWDSDVAKWIEGAAYITEKHPTPALEEKIDELVREIEKNQGEDGYFNIYFTVVDPEGRFKDRSKHELYCAGHLIEAAIAYHRATGKRAMLDCMEKYCAYIERVFIEEKSAAFATPGHEEIELALLRLYRHTGNERYLRLAAHFLNTRGTDVDVDRTIYNQSHLPIREQKEAAGHSVRAVYLYTGMAMLAKETGDEALADACRALWEDIVLRKMYITGGIGSTYVGESFTVPFDLPSDQAYTETCAGIGMIFFSLAMQELSNDARYADVIERVLYNGVLSGLSLSGDAFFYENPLEINLGERFENIYGKRRFPKTRRQSCFSTSCCPPNIARLLASLGGCIYATEGDTLFVNQFISSTVQTGTISCTASTDYPRSGAFRLQVSGAARVAVRIPGWCREFSCDRSYVLENGYAVIEGSGEISFSFAMTPRLVYPDPRIRATAGRAAVMRGPIVYCAEAVDNGGELCRIRLPKELCATENASDTFGLPTLSLACERYLPQTGALYLENAPEAEPMTLHMIPYSCFANREESDMAVWLLR